jgi:uncharacterized surface protein with fasciclin (FAS1) repeats
MLKRMSQILPVFLVAVLFAATAVPALAMKPERTTIVDVALDANAESGEFSILIQALLAADPAVIDALGGNGQFTVFAPTDAAFVALLGELGLTAEELLAEKELVTQVLLYHVLNGRRDSTDILGSDRLRTLERGFLFQNGGVLTDANGRSANIIATDIVADNGIIHVIDRVVLP